MAAKTFREWFAKWQLLPLNPIEFDLERCWKAATEAAEEKFKSTNKQMVSALDDIRAIAFGRGDSVTKVQKVQDIITRLNATKA